MSFLTTGHCLVKKGDINFLFRLIFRLFLSLNNCEGGISTIYLRLFASPSCSSALSAIVHSWVKRAHDAGDIDDIFLPEESVFLPEESVFLCEESVGTNSENNSKYIILYVRYVVLLEFKLPVEMRLDGGVEDS